MTRRLGFAQRLRERAGDDKWKWSPNRARAAQIRRVKNKAALFSSIFLATDGGCRPGARAIPVAFAGARSAGDAAASRTRLRATRVQKGTATTHSAACAVIIAVLKRGGVSETNLRGRLDPSLAGFGSSS